MAQWIDFYNNERLHGALLYLISQDYFEGRKESRLVERREKLHTLDINRKAYWLQQSRLKTPYKLTKKSPNSLWAGQENELQNLIFGFIINFNL